MTRTPADPAAPFWTMDDIAAYWSIDPGTVRDYRYASMHPRPGMAARLPAADDRIGNNPVWYPSTITGFMRPGRGAGGGPKPGRARGGKEQAA